MDASISDGVRVIQPHEEVLWRRLEVLRAMPLGSRSDQQEHEFEWLCRVFGIKTIKLRYNLNGPNAMRWIPADHDPEIPYEEPTEQAAPVEGGGGGEVQEGVQEPEPVVVDDGGDPWAKWRVAKAAADAAAKAAKSKGKSGGKSSRSAAPKKQPVGQGSDYSYGGAYTEE